MPNVPENPASLVDLNPGGAPIYYNESTGILVTPTETVRQVQEENIIQDSSTSESRDLANKIVSGQITPQAATQNYPISVVNQAVRQANLLSSRSGIERAVDSALYPNSIPISYSSEIYPVISTSFQAPVDQFSDYHSPYINEIPGYTGGILTNQSQLDQAIILGRLANYKTDNGYNLSQAFKDKAINASEAKIVGFKDSSILDSFRSGSSLAKFDNFKNEDGYNLKQAYNSYLNKEEFKLDAKQAGFSDLDIALVLRSGVYGPTREEVQLGPITGSPYPSPIRSYEGSRGLSGKTEVFTNEQLNIKLVPSLVQDFKNAIAPLGSLNPDTRTSQQKAVSDSETQKFLESFPVRFITALPEATKEVLTGFVPFIWIKDSDKLSKQEKILNTALDATLVVGLLGKKLNLTTQEIKNLSLLKSADREAQLSLDRKAISSDQVNENIKQTISSLKNKVLGFEINKPDFGYYDASGKYVSGKYDNTGIKPTDIVEKTGYYKLDGSFVDKKTRGYYDDKQVFRPLASISGGAFDEVQWNHLVQELKFGNKFDIQEAALELAGVYQRAGITSVSNRLTSLAKDANEFVRVRDAGLSTEKSLERIKAELNLLDDVSKNLKISSLPEEPLLQKISDESLTRAKPTQVITKERISFKEFPIQKDFKEFPIQKDSAIREITSLPRASPPEQEVKEEIKQQEVFSDITNFPQQKFERIQIKQDQGQDQEQKEITVQDLQQDQEQKQREDEGLKQYLRQYADQEPENLKQDQPQDYPQEALLDIPQPQDYSQVTLLDIPQPNDNNQPYPDPFPNSDIDIPKQTKIDLRTDLTNNVSSSFKDSKIPVLSSLRDYPKFAWRQEFIWVGIEYPYEENDIRYFDSKPLGYILVKGPKSAFLGIKKVNKFGPATDTFDEFSQWFTANRE